jgi:hypothetical protein
LLAKCFCPKHGKLDLDDIQILNGQPLCKKCRSALEFGQVRPRRIEKPSPKRKRRKKRRSVKKRAKK